MPRRICIIGGGYSGAAAAIQFARHASAPLDITVVEPRASVGSGTAYSTSDPAVRLNVEDSLMVVHTDALDDFKRWLDESGARKADPEGVSDEGEFFARREDFGRYMTKEFARTVNGNTSGSAVWHCRDKAVSLSAGRTEQTVCLAGGETLTADLVLIAVGNEKPAVLQALPPEVLDHSGHVPDPWGVGALAGIAPGSRILLVGSGLTAVDLIASLTRRSHQGRIDVVSRRGLLPLMQGEFPGIAELLRRGSQPVPALIEAHGEPRTALQVLRWVRADARAGAALGVPWQEAFDRLRDAAKYIWPRLSLTDKRRFFRHLKPYYDVHRFRIAPQVQAIIQARFRAGNLGLMAARIVGGAVDGSELAIEFRRRGHREISSTSYDLLINCTGPNPDPARSEIGLLRDALSDGVLVADPTGVGLAVNERCETLGADGAANTGIIALGQMTRGHFGEVVAVPQITMQLAPLTQRLVDEGLI